VILVPTLPLIVAQLMNVETSLVVMLVPSLSQAILMADLIKGETIVLYQALISMLTTLVYTTGLTTLAVGLYRRERILG